MNIQLVIERLCVVAREAGEIIMQHYNPGVDITIKDDNSPVTAADIAANEHIVSALAELTPDIPIVAEESVNDTPMNEHSTFWLVDPLDGTKSFIKRTGEFTVNIGLVEKGTATYGVVYVPAQQVLYYTDAQKRAHRVNASGDQVIHTRNVPKEGMVVVASASHRTPETDDYIATLKVQSFMPASSSLKFCLLAEGKADIYPRFGPTMEWDTAAAHAVLHAAGGRVENPDGTPFTYGKAEFRNGHFIAWGR